MNRIYTIRADIKLRLIYTCSVCGKQEVGSPFNFKLTVGSSDELKEKIDSTYVRNAYMPIGWSYCDDYKCHECAHKNEE